MPSATMTSRGQVTIPRPIRQILKVQAGDRLDFLVDDQGQVLLRAGGTDITELRGLLHRRGRRPANIKEMNAAIGRRHGRRR
jgi:antitoxin PrlF